MSKAEEEREQFLAHISINIIHLN